MALTVNNFWGAETGGLEETYTVSGDTEVTATDALSDTRALSFVTRPTPDRVATAITCQLRLVQRVFR